MGRLLSVVVSVYNEEKVLEEFYRETTHVLEHISWNYGLLFISDGSRDGSQDILDRMATSDPKIRVISFSRNFGRKAAMTAELDYSRGDGIIYMDADLQHPPGCISDILARFEGGYQVINMVRIKNRAVGLVKNITSSGLYWLINQISDVHFETNASDFFAVSRHVAQVLKNSYGEEVCFLRGYVQNAGFKKTAVEYEARARVAGESRYSIKKLFVFSINTILCSSNMPPKLGIYTGISSALLGLTVMIYILCIREGVPNGYTTTVVLICFMFAMVSMIIDIVSERITILFTELKDRPIHIVDRTENIVQRENAD